MVPLSGELHVSAGECLCVRVPNKLAVGAFEALDEVGLVLPTYGTAGFNARLEVMSAEELGLIGGSGKITERGKHFEYFIDGIETQQTSYSERRYARYWFFKARSASLGELRRTYGLETQPDSPFRIVFAARPRMVTRANSVSKLSELVLGNAADVDSGKFEAGENLELVNSGDFDLCRFDEIMQRDLLRL